MEHQIVKHLRSEEVVDNKAKLPQSNDIDYGEIAINYASGHETLSFKNNDGEIFYIDLNSLKNLVKEVIKDEKVTAYALTNIVSTINQFKTDTNERLDTIQGTFEQFAAKEWYGTQEEFNAITDYEDGVNYYIYD